LRQPWLRHWIELDALHPHYSMVDGAYMSWARERDYRVNVWTVDDLGNMKQLVRLGVDAIITRRPDLLSQVLQAGRVP
jgi:glycerophosphoryl diester phosphodiesterase